MLRQLPPTITADKTPEWLPAGWIAQSKVLKRGREIRTYTQLKTGKKFFTKDHVLQYIEMEKVREKREFGIERAKASLKASSFFQSRDTTVERPSWLPDNWEMELRIGSTSEKIYEVEVLADEEMSSFSDDKFSEAEALVEKGQNENNAAEEAQAVSLEEENLHDVVIEFDEKASGFTGSSGVLINLECQPVSISTYHGTDSLVEKDLHKNATEDTGTRNVELNSDELIGNKDSDLMLNTTSTKVEAARGMGDKSEEPLKAETAQEENKRAEKTANELGRSLFFPSGDAPAHSVIVFGTPNARSSLGDLRNTVEFGLNPSDSLKGKNIGVSKKRKLNKKTCSSKNIKKKDTETPRRPTKKPQKLKMPSIPQGESSVNVVCKKGSSSIVMEQSLDYWPDLCPTFPFEPLTSSSRIEDDSVIRRYLEQHATAARNADCNLPLPDFGLPSFSDIKISLDEETDKQQAFTKMKSIVHPCIQVASSSLPSCSSMGTTMQQTVAGI